MLSFEALSPGWNILPFCLAAGVVWRAGIRLTQIAELFSHRLGGKQALIGMLFLGGIVSLPEMATSVAASSIGNAPLAINTLLGGIAVTMVILAVVDAITGPEPLSVDVAHPIVLFQGSLVILFLSITAAGIVAGDVPLLATGVGTWTSALLVLYLIFLVLIRRYESIKPWVPRRVRGAPPRNGAEAERSDRISMRALIFRAVTVSSLVIVAGFVLASTGDALARQTALGAGFIGMVLGGIATSLPELSTTLQAVRQRQYEMAFADAFGTNLFSIMLLFAADAAYPQQPLLNEAGRFSVFAILLGIAVTAVYLAGLIVRRNCTVLRMGVDSLIVLVLYAGGLVVLFQLR